MIKGTLFEKSEGDEAAVKVRDIRPKPDHIVNIKPVSHFAADDDPSAEGDIVVAWVETDSPPRSSEAHDAIEELQRRIAALTDDQGRGYFANLEHY